MTKAALTALLSVIFAIPARSEMSADSAHVDTMALHGVTVTASMPPSALRMVSGGAEVRVSSVDLRSGMRTFGEADVTRALRMAPGITTVGDYGAGLSVDGAPASGTAYLTDGATVIMPFHFGGIVSAYHTPHYSTFTLNHRGGTLAPMTIGGVLEAKTSDNIPPTAYGQVNIGMIGSGAAAHIPVGKSTAIHAAARVSYIDLLYGPLLKFDGTTTHYILGDANLAIVHRIDDKNLLKAAAIWSGDKVRIDDDRSSMDTRLTWYNTAASVVWYHKGSGIDWTQNVSYTHYDSRLDMRVAPISVAMPSGVDRWTSAGEGTDRGGWTYGYRVEYTSYLPQYAQIDGDESGERHRLKSLSLAAEIGRHFDICNRLHLDVDAMLWWWSSEGYKHLGVDPRVAVIMDIGKGVGVLSIYHNTQTTHTLGFSELGSAADFMLPAGSVLAPIYATGADLRYTMPIGPEGMEVSASIFGRDVRNMAEYYGNVLDVTSSGYDPYANVIVADGYDTGATAAVEYLHGGFGARASYSYTASRRKYPMYPGVWLPSAIEPRSRVKLSADWQTGRWTLSAAWVYADGRRYTPVAAIFIVGGNVLTEYCERNSASLPSCHRLDLSATYNASVFHIAGREIRSLINFSIANAYGRRNIEMQYYMYDPERKSVRLHRVPTLYRFLPSISYTLVF